jgi:methylase of polypeptide subunit release factors
MSNARVARPPRDERHRYGQHYTPREVAQLLAAFAVRSGDDIMLDPACGDGRLLAESLRLKKALSETGSSGRREVFGVDRSPEAIRRAAGSGAQVAVSDFFDIAPGDELAGGLHLPAAVDAVIANPPYIRQEIVGRLDKERVRRRLDEDRAAAPDLYWPRWSGRSDIYVYFFAHAARFLRPRGRLVFLTSSSWLDAGYGAPLREFLLQNFRVLAVIESAAESFFSDASINTTITVLEREPRAGVRESGNTRFVQLQKPICQIANRRDGIDEYIYLARSIEKSRHASGASDMRVRTIRQAELIGQTAGGWGRYVRAEDVFFRIVNRGNTRLRSLSDMARVRFGVKTGANSFFYVKGAGAKGDSGAGGRVKRLRDVASVRRGLTTGANEFFYLRRLGDGAPGGSLLTRVLDSEGRQHLIESKYMSPVVFSLKEIAGIILERDGFSRLFFNCADAPERIEHRVTLRYIQSGERAGYHLRPSCASRDPWYAVARSMRPAPLIFPSKVGERWLVAINRARVFEDKKLYGVFPRRGVGRLQLAALLNSTWTRYYTEVTCRQMTGAQAIADIDVTVAEQVLLPDPRELTARMKRKLGRALMELARRPILSVFEETKRPDRMKLDELMLEAIGFTDERERRETLRELYRAVTDLVRRRLEKSAKSGLASASGTATAR